MRFDVSKKNNKYLYLQETEQWSEGAVDVFGSQAVRSAAVWACWH